MTYFSQDSGDRKRFLAVVECENIPSPQVLNKLVLLYAPETFKSDPAFDKNTDLIILHKLRNRADFNGIESKVFGIEENPYYFKNIFFITARKSLGC
ncbi:ABC-three component system middle component 1 [Escherichia coli]|uniref:ABC-three component system middle component 1 n=1 Tax=Escherichia coli TaxID=562 RepID=UPI001CDD7B1F|nr:ABC-three component system middle component 1 [Escherichia coli]